MSEGPISPDLWRRFQAIDAVCDITMNRRTEYQHVGAGSSLVWTSIPGDPGSTRPTRRAWYVRLTRHDGEMIHSIEPAMSDAIEKAIAEAERKGWNRSSAAPAQ